MFLPQNSTNLQMSSCLTGGGGRTYAFELEIVKSASSASTTRNSNASSSPPSSTLSESSNSGLAITTRKPRTPRKRPNQTYNEAAALLSTAYPNLFSNPIQFSKLPPHFNPHASSPIPFDDSTDLLLPFQLIDDDEDGSGFLLHHRYHHRKHTSRLEFKLAANSSTSCQSPGEFDSRPNSNCDSELMDLGETATTTTTTSTGYAYQDDDFDAESILDEEFDEGGIDSIMGNLTVDSSAAATAESSVGGGFCYGYPMGLGLGLGGRFELGLGMMRRGGGGISALRNVDEGNWWSFPTVDVMELSPKFRKAPAPVPDKKKKKKAVVSATKEKEEKKSAVVTESKSLELVSGSKAKNNEGLSLKLNYDDVLNAWSDKGSPFSDDAPGSDLPENDVTARLAQIDLFPETGGVREASVLRYKEKRRTRLFSKKIRYQVRKVNADRRPRMKGRFVRRPNSRHE
ncbi:protein CHLOROPLAST IMPORT APPARATUS 2-like [Humulus lupulus]|uniref:protein CHLOROPLAST IMPORT APPARATUS 2-like n=1 Tax=Humulus lupulus TaxID=3486 RepID=UPI002B4016C4|nr:protein CHLOROPLAST IMPORT APPARATUS 2-like [Humulus lupulus]